MKRKLKGFTLVELVIVIAIVIILSVVSVPIYNGYTKKAKMSEAYALLGIINAAQRAYFSEYGNFYTSRKSILSEDAFHYKDEVLGINAMGNKYCSVFNVNDNGERIDYFFSAYVKLPDELVGDNGKTTLTLFYNITSGATYKQNY